MAVLGHDDIASAVRGADNVDRHAALPCVTAYCPTCRKITWLARQTSLADSLLDFYRRLEEYRCTQHVLCLASVSSLASPLSLSHADFQHSQRETS